MSDNLNVLALDPATKTGWALRVGGRHYSGVQSFALKRGESPGMRYLRARAWLRDMQKQAGKIDFIVYEQPHLRGGHSSEVLMGFVTEIQTFAAEVGAQHSTVHTGTLKKFATGSGNASKKEMVRAAERRYPGCFTGDPKDDNEADARHLLMYAENEILWPESGDN